MSMTLVLVLVMSMTLVLMGENVMPQSASGTVANAIQSPALTDTHKHSPTVIHSHSQTSLTDTNSPTPINIQQPAPTNKPQKVTVKVPPKDRIPAPIITHARTSFHYFQRLPINPTTKGVGVSGERILTHESKDFLLESRL